QKDIKQFTFDHSYWSHDGFKTGASGLLVPDGNNSAYVSQQHVFDDLGRGLLENAFKGYSCSLFAYGQTGSGKSYSMIGYGPNRGIVPIICEELFNKIDNNRDFDKKFQVTLSMMEIYNEQIRDLLTRDKLLQMNLQIRQSPVHGFYVQGLTQIPVGSYVEIEQRMKQGTARRTVAATNMNETSSRAHTLITLTFDQFLGTEETKLSRKRSIINLVDLAGSERADSTGATGDRLKEGAKINRSLSALGNVISALAENKKIVPYRDSVLTKLLQNALGGNSKTVMIAAISPADINYDETLSTLRYADRAKQIKNTVLINEDPMESLIRELKAENERLKKSLSSIELPSSVVVENLTPTEIEKLKDSMRREMMEQMEINLTEMEAQNQAKFEEKLRQARQEITQQTIPITKQLGDSRVAVKSKPYLSNLNEDPQLSGVIVHVLFHKQTGIGREPPNETQSNQKSAKIYWIQMKGLCMVDEHALLIRHGKTGAEVELRALPNAIRMTKVNGVPVKNSVTLQHKDRILFGSHQLYVFCNPLSKEYADELKSGKEPEVIDWEFAQRELAQAIGFEQFGNKPKQKEEAILQQQLLELLPLINEVNAIAEELNKQRKFEVILLPPTAQAFKYGELKRTKVMIRMKCTNTGHMWLWDRGKFMTRRFLMQDMYQKYLNKQLEDYSQECDPFWEPLEDLFIGIAPAFLRALAYRLDVNEELKIMDFIGDELGTVNVKLIPCSSSALPSNNTTSGNTDVAFVEDPRELIGKPFNFKIMLSSPNLYDSEQNKCKFTVYYRVFKESELTKVKMEPNELHTRSYSIDQVTLEHLDYFHTEFICFMIYCSQYEKDAKKHHDAYSSGSLFPRRYSHLSVEELNDISKLKTELTILQRGLDLFIEKDKQLDQLYKAWANKSLSADNFKLILEDIHKLVNRKVPTINLSATSKKTAVLPIHEDEERKRK
ncbi:Kinesin-like protein, partial [Schistosoma japonicum]